MRHSLAVRADWIVAAIIALTMLACQSIGLIAQADPTPTDIPLRPTLTRVPPSPAPTVPPPPPPTARPTQTRRPPTARPIPTRTFTPAPPPTGVPPTATPDPDAGYAYRVGKITCIASTNTRIEGTITENGSPLNGVLVRVSGAPHGPKAIDDATTGINPADYKRADPTFAGKYRLGLYEGQRIAGNWFVFVVNAAGEPLSRDANAQTTSEASCNSVTIDFTH